MLLQQVLTASRISQAIDELGDARHPSRLVLLYLGPDTNNSYFV